MLNPCFEPRTGAHGSHCVFTGVWAGSKPEQTTPHPYSQVPWWTGGDQTIFETDTVLLCLGHRSPTLMPADPHARQGVVTWVFAAQTHQPATGQPETENFR